jgi:hypothetical protein
MNFMRMIYEYVYCNRVFAGATNHHDSSGLHPLMPVNNDGIHCT